MRRGVKTIVTGDLDVTLLRLNRGVVEPKRFTASVEFRASVGAYGFYSRAEQGITRAVYMTVEKDPITAARNFQRVGGRRNDDGDSKVIRQAKRFPPMKTVRWR